MQLTQTSVIFHSLQVQRFWHGAFSGAPPKGDSRQNRAGWEVPGSALRWDGGMNRKHGGVLQTKQNKIEKPLLVGIWVWK